MYTFLILFLEYPGLTAIMRNAPDKEVHKSLSIYTIHTLLILFTHYLYYSHIIYTIHTLLILFAHNLYYSQVTYIICTLPILFARCLYYSHVTYTMHTLLILFTVTYTIHTLLLQTRRYTNLLIKLIYVIVFPNVNKSHL